MLTRSSIAAWTPWRSPCTARDARTTIVTGSPVPRGRRGFTVIELLVVVAITAIMAGTAYWKMRATPYAAWQAQSQVLADIRRARNDALTKGDHFRLDITSATTYVTYRMQLVGAVWVPNGPPIRTATLPSGVAFTTGIGRQLEFTTRGLMLVPDAATTLTMVHSASSTYRNITVWPSGQVSPA